MPISITDVSFNRSTHTAGATDCLGGPVGTVLLSQSVTQPTIITGVYVSQAFSNGLGYGQLSYNPVSQTLSWKPPGSLVTYISAAISASGSLIVGGEDGTLVVNVTYASLPSSYKVESLTIAAPIHTVFSQVTGTMSLVGATQYRCIYFKNGSGALTANDVRLYIHKPTALPQVISIGVDPAGVGDGVSTGVAQTIADENTAPTGVVFSAPLSAGTGIVLGVLPPGQSIAVWQRRVVPSGAYGGLTISSVTLGVALVG